MARLEALCAALAEREQALGQRRIAVEPHQSFGPDQPAGRPEQRVPLLASAKHDPFDLVDRPLDNPRVAEMHPRRSGAHTPFSDGQSHGKRSHPQHLTLATAIAREGESTYA